MPVAQEMTLLLLLLLFGGSWPPGVSPESVTPTASLTSSVSETPHPKPVTSTKLTRDPEKADGTGDQLLPSTSSAHFRDTEESPLGTSTDGTNGTLGPGPTTSQEISNEKPLVLPEVSNATRDLAVLETGGPMTTSSLETSSPTPGWSRAPVTTVASSGETSSGTSGTPITMATSSVEPSRGASGTPITMATSSVEISRGTSRPSVTMATSSVEPSRGTSGTPFAMATSSVATSRGTSGTPIAIATSSVATSRGTSGTPIAMATSSVLTSRGTSGSPGSAVQIPTMTTAEPSGNASIQSKSGGLVPVAVLIALLMVIVLVALLLLWRRRQKHRTGILMLNRGGERNGVVDAWAGPARVADEEAVVATAQRPGSDKASGVPKTEESGRRPTLTTFFGRPKSHQCSVALEELRSGSGPSLSAEEEPLVGSEEGVEDAPTSNGPEVGPGAAPQGL
ncbi:leukosialin [Lepus europaeus]|uniref:leukosialin n=1 Tax=Lepus europaeus TaxID=9983 RepID=UPI002B4A62B6|nr:leukosialin [Lepus europaeus]